MGTVGRGTCQSLRKERIPSPGRSGMAFSLGGGGGLERTCSEIRGKISFLIYEMEWINNMP
jgi:hypothetical protein